jgi:hypothetical protein
MNLLDISIERATRTRGGGRVLVPRAAGKPRRRFPLTPSPNQLSFFERFSTVWDKQLRAFLNVALPTGRLNIRSGVTRPAAHAERHDVVKFGRSRIDRPAQFLRRRASAQLTPPAIAGEHLQRPNAVFPRCAEAPGSRSVCSFAVVVAGIPTAAIVLSSRRPHALAILGVPRTLRRLDPRPMCVALNPCERAHPRRILPAPLARGFTAKCASLFRILARPLGGIRARVIQVSEPPRSIRRARSTRFAIHAGPAGADAYRDRAAAGVAAHLVRLQSSACEGEISGGPARNRPGLQSLAAEYEHSNTRPS